MTDERPTVLIVDDDRVNRSTLAELLHLDYRVLLAKDGESALRHAEREAGKLTLILLDVTMPGMSGYDVLLALRRQERTAGIPVIFITGHSDGAAEEYGLQLGAADYVPKPVRPAIVLARVRNQVNLVLQKNRLERQVQIDGLTGLANRRHFDESLERSVRRAMRSGDALGLALIDIDHFKQYNDHYGHVAGDDALRQVAATLQTHARRADDLAARIGGEEFALLVPGPDHLFNAVEQFRLRLAKLRIPHASSPTAPHLTVSVGALITTVSTGEGPNALLRLADELLYGAKGAGRNRVSVHRQIA